MCGSGIADIFSSASDIGSTVADVAAVAAPIIQAGAQLQAGGAALDIAKQDVKLIERQKDLDLQALDREKQRTLARQKTGFAKSGVRRTGSVLEVMKQTAQEAEEEALNIQFGAAAGSQARLFEGRQQQKAGQIDAVGTLLTGFGGR